MKQFSLWMEGYAATGNSSSASYLGTYEGENFLDAYHNYLKVTYGVNKLPDYINQEFPSIWGCRIFDNEHDARKSFG